jgi:hypothetical protein
MMQSELVAWEKAFHQAWLDSEALVGLSCPHCGHVGLCMAFVKVTEDANRVMFSFWCPECMHGLPPGISTLPAGQIAVPKENAGIPNYRAVQS